MLIKDCGSRDRKDNRILIQEEEILYTHFVSSALRNNHLRSATKNHKHKGQEETKKIIQLNTQKVYHLQTIKNLDLTNRRNYLT